MKKFEAQSNLPFDIKKGDILTEVKGGKLMKENGEVVPFDPAKETTFFKEVKELKLAFEKDSMVILKKPEKNPNLHTSSGFSSGSSITIPAWTPLKIVGAVERYRKPYAVVDFNGYKYEIKEEVLSEYVPYFFINSKGEIHPAMTGREPQADIFRFKSKNYFNTKLDAQATLEKILAKPLPVKTSAKSKEKVNA